MAAKQSAQDAASGAPAGVVDGFHLLLDALKLNGLDTLYALPGIPITDLTRLAQSEGMRVISFRHEQNAGHAAAAAGFLTARPGVCLTVSAPGFLNALVALANATTNAFPMILLSGSSEREIVDLQQGDYEEMDQLAIARPLCKAAFRVLRAEDIGIAVARALRAALSGRPGGVYLDLPARVFTQTLDAAAARRSLVRVVDAAPAQLPAADALARALALLRSARRGLIVLGKGAAYARADAAIRELVERSGLPYLPMSMAKGLLPDNHAQSAAAARSFVLQQADVVLLVGARLNWLLAHGKGRTWGDEPPQFVQIDIAAAEMDSNVAIAAPLVGDIASCVRGLLQGMGEDWPRPPQPWLQAVAERRERNVARMAQALAANPMPMNFHSALRVVRDIVREHPDIHLVNEGANTLDFTRSIVDMARPRTRLDVGTWGVMGVGMGFAIAAAVTGARRVLAIEGDSAFGFCAMEIETICRYALPVCIVVFNNNGVYKGTDRNLGGGTDPAPTVFVKGARYDMLIEAFGGVGVHARTPAELEQGLRAALDSGRPTLINAVIDEAAGTESGRLAALNPGAVPS